MDSQDFPTEDEQYEAYKAVLEGMNGKPVVVRTMDIGGDKELPYFDMPHENEPIPWIPCPSYLYCRNWRCNVPHTNPCSSSCFCSWSIAYHVPNGCLLKEFRAAKAVL